MRLECLLQADTGDSVRSIDRGYREIVDPPNSNSENALKPSPIYRRKRRPSPIQQQQQQRSPNQQKKHSLQKIEFPSVNSEIDVGYSNKSSDESVMSDELIIPEQYIMNGNEDITPTWQISEQQQQPQQQQQNQVYCGKECFWLLTITATLLIFVILIIIIGTFYKRKRFYSKNNKGLLQNKSNFTRTHIQKQNEKKNIIFLFAYKT